MIPAADCLPHTGPSASLRECGGGCPSAGPPLPNLRAGRYALCTRCAISNGAIWCDAQRAHLPPGAVRPGAACRSWLTACRRGACPRPAVGYRYLLPSKLGTYCSKSRASRPTCSPLALVLPEGAQYSHLTAPAACGCGLPARLPPGGGWVSCQKPCPFHCAARVGFHALITHAGVRVDAFVLALACFASTAQLLLRMHANLAQGRAGLEPAGGLKPLRPMICIVRNRKPALPVFKSFRRLGQLRPMSYFLSVQLVTALTVIANI